HDQRKLCAQINRLLRGQPVAQLVKDASQDDPRLRLVGEIASVAQLLEPDLNLLDRMRYARGNGHLALPCSIEPELAHNAPLRALRRINPSAVPTSTPAFAKTRPAP